MRLTLLSLFLALLLCGCGENPEEQPKPEPADKTSSENAGLGKGAALVLTLEGKVTVLSPSDANGTAVRANQFLAPGDSLVTGPNSEVLLLLTNGTTLSVGANTTFELKSFYQDQFDAGDAKVGSLEEEASDSTVLLDLKVGELVVDIKRLRKKSNFEISTPLGVAGIRGTSFKLLASADSTALSVLTGRVDFVSPSEESFQVEANQGILAPKDEEPKVSPLSKEEKQAIQQAVDKAREKAAEVDLGRLSKKLSSKTRTVPSAANLEMIWVEPGSFTMGCPSSEESGNQNNDTSPQHEVTITKGFYLGKYEVTQAQWMTVMGANPSRVKGDNLPRAPVNWFEVKEFCAKLTEMEQNASRLQSGWEYTLPTEAEWEYACRAGTTTAFCWGNDINSSMAHYGRKAQAKPVGSYSPNNWGFYDMHGNIVEWCYDWSGEYSDGPRTDPLGPTAGTHKVQRGGSWFNPWFKLRSASRSGNLPSDRGTSGSTGFRIAYKRIGK